MKHKTNLQHWFRCAGLSVMLASSISLCRAQSTNYVVDTFDDGSTVTSWSHDWGSPSWTIEWDPSMDAKSNINSGALKITINYDLATYGGGNDAAVQRFLGQNVDMTLYTNIHLDVFVATNSSHLSGWGNGALGNMSFYMRDPSWAFASLGDKWIDSSAYGTWKHVVYPIDQLKLIANQTNNIAPDVARFGWQMWSGWSGVGQTNTVTYWIDNVTFEYNTNTAPPPHPALALKPNPSRGGVMIVSSSGQYDRNSIATDTSLANSDFGWVGSGLSPVTYSLTITNFPGPQYAGFQNHIFLVPNSTGKVDPDWSEPNLIFLDIHGNSNGTASAWLRYKTNEAGGNTFLYGAGTVTRLNSSTGPLGTWSMSFQNDTNVTLTAPSGAATNLFFPDVTALQSLFSGPVQAYFGNQPNQTWNEGQSSTFSRVKITGAPRGVPVDDTFPGPDINQNPPTAWGWIKKAAAPAGIFVVGSDDLYQLSWSLPDIGFTLQVSPNLLPGSWTNVGPITIVAQPKSKLALIPKSVLPDLNHSFFRLAKPLATKLQVLMPGETAAPGTASGKTGTPTAQAVGVPFNVTVNAVDAAWNPINYVTDKIHIACSDTAATLPADANLVGGTKVFTVTVNTAGNFTVTASDVTDTSKAPNTGTSTMAN